MADRKDSIKGMGDTDSAKPPTQRCGLCGHLMALFDNHQRCIRCRNAKKRKTFVSKGLIVIPDLCSIPNKRNWSLFPNTGKVKEAVKKEKKATSPAVSLTELQFWDLITLWLIRPLPSPSRRVALTRASRRETRLPVHRICQSTNASAISRGHENPFQYPRHGEEEEPCDRPGNVHVFWGCCDPGRPYSHVPVPEVRRSC